MKIELWYSNSTEKLAEALACTIQESRRQRTLGSLEKAVVIVPNLNIAAFLRFEIARLKGIASLLDFRFLDVFLSELPTKTDKPVRILTRDMLHALLTGVFSKENYSYLPSEVNEYLNADSDNYDLRRFQLAGQLARIFSDYSLSRTGMIEKWNSDSLLFTGEDMNIETTEKWQRSLWKKVLGSDGIIKRIEQKNGIRYIFPHEIPLYISECRESLPKTLYFFGFSYISMTHNIILHQLSQYISVHFFTLNPCREFWEDASTFPEKWNYEGRFRMKTSKDNSGEGEDPFHLGETTENTILSLWGRPGRENIRILNEMTDFNFHEAYEIFNKDKEMTLLQRIRDDILSRKRGSGNANSRNLNDQSIRILACPDIRREVEIIANEIWDLVITNHENIAGAEPPLRFSDIALIIADSGEFDSYRTHIDSVFNEIHEIPHSISDASGGGDSRIAEAAELLLNLPLSDFKRSDLLRILMHPAVGNRFPDADQEEWMKWCVSLPVLHGISRTYHSETYIKKDIYNWDQGIRRLVLGAFMTGLRSGDNRIYTMPGTDLEYLPEEYPQGSLSNVSRFIMLVRSLITDALFLKEEERTLSEMADLLSGYFRSYLAAVTDEDDEILTRCIRAADSLRTIDPDGRKVPYVIAKEFVSASLSASGSSAGRYLTDGVVVSSFLPMRPIPFRIAFIAGLGEDRFPAHDQKKMLDLRTVKRMPGDVSPRERDQYNFLETLVSTKERLFLSYVSRDSQTGENIEPSSVIQELLHIIEHEYCVPPESIVIKHPLRRYDAAYFPELYGNKKVCTLPNHSPVARKEACAEALRHITADNVQNFENMSTIEKTSIFQQKPEYIKFFSFHKPRPSGIAPKAGQIIINYSSLKKFLECPLQGWAAFRLGMTADEEENPYERNDEPFETEFLRKWKFHRTVFSRFTSENRDGKTSPDVIMGEERVLLELKGEFPSGDYGEWAADACSSVLKTWINIYRTQFPEKTLKTIRFGSGSELFPTDECFSSIPLGEIRIDTSRGTIAELSGMFRSVLSDNSGIVILTEKKEVEAKYFLEGFLAYVFMVAAGKIDGLNPFTVTLITAGENEKTSSKTISYSIMNKDSALVYLKEIVKELLYESHTYLLPIETVLDCLKNNKMPSDIHDTSVNSNKKTKCDYGPLRSPDDYSPPENEHARIIMEQRFGPFIQSNPSLW